MDNQELTKDTLLFGAKGSYVIEEVLGRGGFGITYSASATGENLPEHVAIKEFFPRRYCNRTVKPDRYDLELINESDADLMKRLRDRFVKESRNIEACDHPGIVKVLETIVCNGTAYMVMSLIPGSTVKNLIENKDGHTEPISPEKAENIIRQLADALSYIHDQHITHHDIKPDNLMLTPEGQVVLIDFGLSKQYEEDGSSNSIMLDAISRGYSPYEQYVGTITSFSPESDIYSLGATFYKILTGKTPAEPQQLYESPELLTFGPEIPEHHQKVIRAAMKYRRKDRLKSAEAFLRMLDNTKVKGDDSKGTSVLGWILNVILLLIAGACIIRILNEPDYYRQYYAYFYQNGNDLRLSLGIDAIFAALGLFIRPAWCKTVIASISLVVLLGLWLNTL